MAPVSACRPRPAQPARLVPLPCQQLPHARHVVRSLQQVRQLGLHAAVQYKQYSTAGVTVWRSACDQQAARVRARAAHGGRHSMCMCRWQAGMQASWQGLAAAAPNVVDE